MIESIERIRAGKTSPDWDPRLFAKPLPRFPVEGKRVLVAYLFSGLGDAVLLAPVVKALLDRGAAAPIQLLIPRSGARVFSLFDLPVKAIDPEKKPSAKKIDIAIDLSLREGLDARPHLQASNAKLKLGWMRRGETLEKAGLDFGTPDTRTETTLHWSRASALPLAPLGVERPSFDVSFKKTSGAKKLWGPKSADKPRVLLIPGGRAEEKRWDESRFALLGRWAREERGASIVVAGAPSEAKLARAVLKGAGGGTKYCGKNLGTLVDLVRTASVVITNDTGPMHLAFLLGIPTIAVFTHMSPLVWGPPKNDPRHVVINARPESGGDDAITRLARHHLDRLLSRPGGR